MNIKREFLKLQQKNVNKQSDEEEGALYIPNSECL